MNWRIFFLESIIMVVVFGVFVFGLLMASPLTFISDYPPEIQDRYCQTQHKEAAKGKLTVIMLIKKAAALIIFAFLFAWMAHKARVETFLQSLLTVYGYMLILAAFDTCILDWLLFPRIRRIRLPGTEDMDREYHQKWFHVKVMFPMLPLFLAGGVVISVLVTTLW